LHKYLRAVGFTDPMNALDRLNLIDDIKTKASYRAEAACLESENDLLTELRLDLAGGCGVSLVGSFGEESDFLAGQVEPYLMPEAPATMEEVYVEERIDNRSYAGICDDMRVGTTLIFRLLNPVNTCALQDSRSFPVRGQSSPFPPSRSKGLWCSPWRRRPMTSRSSSAGPTAVRS